MSQQLHANIPSSLLSDEENEQIFALLGNRCQTLGTSVVELYETEPPHDSQWIKKEIGILCFVKDNMRKNFFFRLYCLSINDLVWEHEVYNNMEYLSPCDFFHSFEGDKCMVAFNFANVMEANNFKSVVHKKLLATKRNREQGRSKTVKQRAPALPSDGNLIYKTTGVAKGLKKTKHKRFTKADIGTPCGFIHVTHVGWNANTGFDMNSDDLQLKQFFAKAGISEEQLQNKKTQKFIRSFVDKHGGPEAIRENILRPSSSATSTISGPSRAAPPPPGRRLKPPSTLNVTVAGVPPTPPPPNTAPPPPPPPTIVPPPPPLPNTVPPAPPPPLPDRLSSPHEPAPNFQSSLLETLQKGPQLKHTHIETKPTAAAPNDLLSEIKSGFHLKPVSEREVKQLSPTAENGDLADALRRAMEERNRAIRSDDDSTSDTDSNDEWDG